MTDLEIQARTSALEMRHEGTLCSMRDKRTGPNQFRRRRLSLVRKGCSLARMEREPEGTQYRRRE
ncbi:MULTISPECIES: hypothetical protein [Rhodomicrobium]|uniref:hypothetical protein n=1 Tax=Rhodomicrobium TaxID=1068 RepID=UPI000F736F52|nr:MULTISPECIES: hypothetical protein [Rhodomicrobium]